MEAQRAIDLIPAHEISRVYKDNRKAFFNFAFKLARNKSNAEDLVQRAFEIALKKPIDRAGALKSFVFSAIYYSYRGDKRDATRQLLGKEAYKRAQTFSLQEPGLEIDEMLRKRDVRNVFVGPMARISFADRRARILALIFKGYTQKEVADQLGICERTVGRDLKALRQEIFMRLRDDFLG